MQIVSRTRWAFLFASCLAGLLTCAAIPAGASEPWRSDGCQNPRLQAGSYTEDNWPLPQTGENRQTIGRTYVVSVPKHHEQPHGTPLPIVIALHGTDTGTGGQGAGLIKGVRLQEASDKHGFIVAAPNAWPWSTWTTADGDAVNRRGFSDIEFLRRLLDILDEKLCIDRNRIFVTGASNGGFMAVRVAQAGAAGELGLLAARTPKETPRRIAAIAPVVAFPPPPGLQLNAHVLDEVASDPFKGRIPQSSTLAEGSPCVPAAGSIRPPDKAVPMHVFYGNEDRLIANSACFGTYLRSAHISDDDRPGVHAGLCGCNGTARCPHSSGIVGDVLVMTLVARCAANRWALENGCTSSPEVTNPGTSGWGRPLRTYTWKCSGVDSSRGDTMLTIFDVRDNPPHHPNNPEIPAGHFWPGGVGTDGGFSATEAIWEFFRNHPR